MWFRPVFLVLVLTRLGSVPAGAPSLPDAATVSGVVHDSIAGAPLAGARVQLVADDSVSRYGLTVISDSAGRFTFGDVPDGQYVLGFFHPTLDSLGLEPTLRAVRVDGEAAVRVDLAIPSPERLRAAVCGPRTATNPGAVVMGVVRDATGQTPAGGVTVAAEWAELSLGPAGVVHRAPRRATTTRESGWFAICNVPSPGTMTLLASRGADSTGRVEIDVPASGFLRTELYLGAVRVVAVDDGPRPGDSTATGRRLVRSGDVRLAGTVSAADGGRPLAGATVSIDGGPRTRANELGDWTIGDAPAGTRTLEIRALGYYPVRRVVHVLHGAAPVHVALVTLKSVLAAVKVTGSRERLERLRGFQQRARSGQGRYLSAADIARLQAARTSDLFRNLPGVYVDDRSADATILMRGLFAERCAPDVYLNGAVMSDLPLGELDAFVRPAEIVGVEVYAAGMVPGQFQRGMGGCGSVVFWTR